MGSKFLISETTDLSSLQDGTFSLNVATILDQALAPNLPVKTDATKQLTSGLIELDDCAFTPLANPYAGTISARDFITAYDTTPVDLNTFIASTLSDLLALASETQFISASPSPNTTTVSSILSTPTIYTNDIYDLASQTQIIQLSNTDINVAASSFTFNGDEVATTCSLGSYLPLAGGMMSGAIDMGTQDITDVAHVTSDGSNGMDLTGSGTTLLLGVAQLGTVMNANEYDLANTGPVYPYYDATYDLGQNGNRYDNLWLSGNISDDTSSVTVAQLQDSVVGVTGLTNQVEQIAPAGQRASWQRVSGATGPQLVYSAGLGVTISTGTGTGASYSTDGGVTWTSCNFNVAPTSILLAGCSTNQVVLLSFSVLAEVYTSPDGINFTKSGTPLPAVAVGFYALWFSNVNLWVCGVNSGPSNYMAYSSDGATWTLGNCSIVPTAIALNSTAGLCVTASGYTSPYYAYSTDGINWTNGSGTTAASRSIAYSPDRNEWASCGVSNTYTYLSPDGMTWTQYGPNNCPNSANPGFLWVSQYARYYLAAPDTDNNYSLWSTPDIRLPMIGTHLEGATNNALNYSLLYFPTYNRFAIGVNSPPYYAYGTDQPVVKALSDSIRIRGAPVAVSKFSMYGAVAVNNTTTETTVSNGSAVGNLNFQASQPEGMSMRLYLYFRTTSSAGDTLTFRFKCNGTTLATIPYAVNSGNSNTPDTLNGSLTVQAGNVLVFIGQYSTGSTMYADPSYNPAIYNAFSITAQWGANVNQLSLDHMDCLVMFMNGA